MKNLKKLIVIALVLGTSITWAQNDRVITTAVPFLTIAADARSSGLGDIGIGTSTDAFSQERWELA